MSVEDLRAIQHQIADLQAALQQNPRRCRRSDSESDHERAPKCSSLQNTVPDKNNRARMQEIDTLIRQYGQNFRIDGCTQDETRVAYRGSYCRGTFQTQWEEYERRPEHREPHGITWIEVKKEVRRQLGEEHVYIDEMCDRWQKATQRTSQTG